AHVAGSFQKVSGGDKAVDEFEFIRPEYSRLTVVTNIPGHARGLHDFGDAICVVSDENVRIEQRYLYLLLAVAPLPHDFLQGKKHLRSEEHTSELQSRENLVCRLLLEKKNIPYTSV